jgi:hypothetical protein
MSVFGIWVHIMKGVWTSSVFLDRVVSSLTSDEGVMVPIVAQVGEGWFQKC